MDVAARGGGQGPMMAAEGGQVNRPGYAWGGDLEHKPTGWDAKQWSSNQGGWDMTGIDQLRSDTKDRYSQWSKQSPELWHNKEYTRSHPTFGWQSSPNATWVQKDWMDQQARLGFPANLNELANVTDEYGRSRKYSHYPERIRKSWYDVTDEYGKGSPQYTDLLQQMDVDIYGKPESYPINKPKSRMEMLMEEDENYAEGGSVMGKDEYDEELNRPNMFLGGAMGLGALLGGAGLLSKIFRGRKRGDIKAKIKDRDIKSHIPRPGPLIPDEDELPPHIMPVLGLLNKAEGGITDLDMTNGGASLGPGTGTSDDIPAMLSDGEFVVTANAVKNLGGGDRMLGAQRMYRMMNQLDPNSQTPAEMSGVGYA